jgi:hypothetical protein
MIESGEDEEQRPEDEERVKGERTVSEGMSEVSESVFTF